jgi:hypothetical protein
MLFMFVVSIRVEPVDPHSGQHTFTLSVKAGGVVRTLCDPVVMKLFSGPHQLDFVVLCVLSSEMRTPPPYRFMNQSFSTESQSPSRLSV